MVKLPQVRIREEVRVGRIIGVTAAQAYIKVRVGWVRCRSEADIGLLQITMYLPRTLDWSSRSDRVMRHEQNFWKSHPNQPNELLSVRRKQTFWGLNRGQAGRGVCM